jgi:hypothetical protein
MKLNIHNTYITDEQVAWLKNQPSFNFSGFVRSALSEEMRKREMTPLHDREKEK